MARQVILAENGDSLLTEGGDYLVTESSSPDSAPFAFRNANIGPARAPARDPRRRSHWDLGRPVVIGAAQPGFHGPGVRLAESPATRNQQTRRDAKSTLRPPSVVTPASTFTPCAQVTDNFTRANQNPIRGIWSAASTAQILSNTLQPAATGGTARLNQPVNPLAAWQMSITLSLIGTGGSTQLGVSRASSGTQRVWFDIDVDRTTITFFVNGTLVATTHRTLAVGDQLALRATPAGASTLYEVFHKPVSAADFQAIVSYSDSAINWALEPVIIPVVTVGDDFDPSGISSFSFCPYTIDGVAVTVSLAQRPRRKTKSTLRPPIVAATTAVFFGPEVKLAYSRRGKAKPRLSVPAVVYGAIYEPIAGFLAPPRSRNPKTISRLGRPVLAVAAQAYYGPKTPFVRIRPVRTRYFLRAPVVINLSPQVYSVSVTLAPSARQGRRATYDLAGPFVIDATLGVMGGTEPVLARSSRGRPKSFLRPPTVTTVLAAFYGPKVELAYSRRGKPKSRLLPVPAAFRPIGFAIEVKLAASKRGKPKSFLRAPTVIDLSPQVYYLATTFARIKPPPVHSILRRPADLIDQADLGYLRTHLAYSRRGVPKPRLSPPAVVYSTPAPPIRGRLVRIRPVVTHSLLRQVIYAATVYEPVAGFLAPPRSTVPRFYSTLQPPTVVATAAAITPIRVTLVRIRPVPTDASVFKPVVITQAQGPQGGIGIQLAPSLRGMPKSKLFPPAVITVVVSLAYPTSVTLAPQRRGLAKSILRAPRVVFTAVELSGPETSLAYSRRGAPKSILRRPADIVDRDDLGYLRVHLAYSRRGIAKSELRPPVPPETFVPIHEEIAVQLTRVVGERKTMWKLRPPVVIDLRPQAYYIATTLARIRPAAVHSVLREPTDLVDAQDLGVVRTHLAYSRRGVPKPRLNPPAVVYSTPAPPIRGKLVQNRPQPVHSTLTQVVYGANIYEPIQGQLVAPRATVPQAQSRLAPPTVVASGTPVRGIIVHLAYSRRGKASASLARPICVFFNEDLGQGPGVWLAYSRRGAPKSTLHPPVVVRPVFVQRPIETTLTRIRPRGTIAILRRPTDIVDQADLGYLRTRLVRIRPARTHPFLRAPAVIDLRPQVYYLSTWLTYSRRGAPKSILRPESKFAPQLKAEYDLRITLAYQSRGKPKSKLRPPTVVTAATPYFRREPTALVRIRPRRTIWRLGRPTDTVGIEDQGSVAVTLAYSRRGRPKSRLLGVVYAARSYAPITITLAPSFRGRPKSILRRPTDLVDREDLGFVRVHLAYSLRGRAKPKLPIVIYAARVYAPIRVVLAPSSRLARAVHARLSAPTVVRTFQAAPISITLAPQRRGAPKSFLGKPTVLAEVIVHEAIFQLVTIRPRRTIWRLVPPAVVNPVVIVYFGPKVTLVRIRPRRTMAMLGAQAVPTICYGIVCGFDYAAVVTGSDSGAEVTGGDSGATVTGSDSAATATGATGSRGNVSGGDERREGC